MNVRPYTIRIPDPDLHDLRRRLATVRWPTSLAGIGWDDGADLAFMKRLVAHWAEGFDWRAQEQRLNRMPQFMADVGGSAIHYVHQRGTGLDPMPLVLTHGWPGSFVEMERLLPLLADAAASGGDPTDAFHVVVPSLPGYGFSAAPDRPGMGARGIART